MVDGSSGSPTAADISDWVGSFGITHPVLRDVTGSLTPYAVIGFPTYVVIDRSMVIQNADMWPWSDSYVLGFI